MRWFGGFFFRAQLRTQLLVESSLERVNDLTAQLLTTDTFVSPEVAAEQVKGISLEQVKKVGTRHTRLPQPPPPPLWGGGLRCETSVCLPQVAREVGAGRVLVARGCMESLSYLDELRAKA
jgi:hypothetical protein